MPKSIVPWVYDLVLWSLSLLLDLFFREIRTRGSYKVPRRSPIIFVAAPHANQFVDPLLLMQCARKECGRRIQFLIAAASMKRKFIGTVAGAIGGIPVARAQDLKKKCQGTVKLANQEQSLKLVGVGTTFLADVVPGSSIVLPGGDTGQAEVKSVESDTTLTLKRTFNNPNAVELLNSAEGTRFSVAPKVDQSAVYEQVFDALMQGGCIGIFPEGGSHDRTELLPLKAGVSIMALGALVANPDCDLKIVPVGMNYFHPHRFRSRAVIEFGTPIDVPGELVEMYKDSEKKRDATKQLLDMIYDGLAAVTVQTSDPETLQLIQAARRLYKPAGKKLPIQSVVELNRRFILGYNKFKNEPRVQDLKRRVVEYNNDLYALGIRDHQLTSLKFSALEVTSVFLYRLAKLLLLTLFSLPGVILFSPVFIATKIISRQKAKEALAGSVVKVQARDVLATWKLLVAMILVPLLYTIYCISGTIVTFKYELGPDHWRNDNPWKVPAAIAFILPFTCYSALRMGEIGVDIWKSLKPLRIAMSDTKVLETLQDRRDALTEELGALTETFAPEVFPDFDRYRVLPKQIRPAHIKTESQSSIVDDALSPMSGNFSGVVTPDVTFRDVRTPTREFFVDTLSSPFMDSMQARSAMMQRERSNQGGQRLSAHMKNRSLTGESVPMSRMRSTDSNASGVTTTSHLDAASQKLREELSSRMAKKRNAGLNSRRNSSLALVDNAEHSAGSTSP